MTPYRRLIENWKDCQRCRLCERRKQVVSARGRVPADVVFVGEAPGESEDVLGSPFVGPAGRLLDKMIATALHDAPDVPTMAWWNLVGCIPKDETNRKKGEPRPDEIEACRPRLESFLEICKPRLIVAVGNLAEKQSKAHGWGTGFARNVIHVVHPANLLRQDVSSRGLSIQRVMIQLSDAFADLRETK